MPTARDAFAARRFQTLPIILARRFGLGRLMPSVVDRYLYRDRDPRRPSSAIGFPAASSCCGARRWRTSAPSTKRFGKYFEDVDMCLRMRLAGWRVMYHGGAYCCHLEQRASASCFSLDAWRHLRAYVRWLRKWGYQGPGTRDQGPGEGGRSSTPQPTLAVSHEPQIPKSPNPSRTDRRSALGVDVDRLGGRASSAAPAWS